MSVVVVASGELTQKSRKAFLERMKPIVRASSVSLDLTEAGEVDAAGLGALVSLNKRAHESGHRIRLVGVQPNLAQLLRDVMLQTLFEIEDRPALRLES
jgi:anti-anti-sigma factor